MRHALPLALLLIPALSSGQAKFGPEKEITPDRLRAHLEFVASDELEGRDTPSKGLDVATLYVATQLKIWGAKPAGDNGTYFQHMALVSCSVDAASSKIEFGGVTYAFGPDIRGNSGLIASGKMVYAGHGYTVKSKGIDPYAGLDVKGKIVVVANGMPNGVSFGTLNGMVEGTDYERPIDAAKKRGAIGVIVVSDMGFPYTPRTSMPPAQPESPGDAPLGSTTVSPNVAKALFAGEKVSAEDALKGSGAPETGFAFSDSKSIQVNVVERKDIVNTRNVVAMIPGSDPVLSKEIVAFGAHIDHVGMRTSGSGDRIFNGADDDGSGTVSILEIAHAVLSGKQRTKRSLLFVWHCGEEKGLWGSEYFTDNPTVDLKQVVAQLNIDMIGRSKKPGDTNPANKVLTGPDELYVVGSTKMSTDLQKTSEVVNKAFLKLGFNYKYDDPADTERIFYRSDHYNYARKGIPIIFYFDGVHEDYHRPGDEPSKIDYLKMSKIARTVLATGWTLANAAKRPVVDKPLTN